MTSGDGSLSCSRFSSLDASLDRSGDVRQHPFDARALGPVSFAQSVSISRTGQTFAPASSSTEGRLQRRSSETRRLSILPILSILSIRGMSGADPGRRFDSYHLLSLHR